MKKLLENEKKDIKDERNKAQSSWDNLQRKHDRLEQDLESCEVQKTQLEEKKTSLEERIEILADQKDDMKDERNKAQSSQEKLQVKHDQLEKDFETYKIQVSNGIWKDILHNKDNNRLVDAKDEVIQTQRALQIVKDELHKLKTNLGDIEKKETADDTECTTYLCSTLKLARQGIDAALSKIQ